MIEVIGRNNCTICKEVKGFLEDRGIKFEYTLIEDYSDFARDELLKLAGSKNITTMPLIFVDSELITIDELKNRFDLNITKRNGDVRKFDKERIVNAINNAIFETGSIDYNLADRIAYEISTEVSNFVNVEDIQDEIVNKLKKYNRKDVAARYSDYRKKKAKERNIKSKLEVGEGLLSDEFISEYKHQKPPFTPLGEFVYYRTYSRWLDELGRREYWWETVRRAVEYNCSLAPNTTREEAEKIYDNVFNLRQFLSGRTLFTGGTQASIKYPLSNYNCALRLIDSIYAFGEVLYVLTLGTGVGVRVLQEDVENLPPMNKNIEIIHKEYKGLRKKFRAENTSVVFKHNTATITIADSKEGWKSSLDIFFNILSGSEYRNIETIVVNYDNIRPKGERLKTFGGKSSGYESMFVMFTKIDKVIKGTEGKGYVKLRPIDCLDVCNIIGENIVSGGVRRTSEVGLFDEDDTLVANGKNELYQNINGEWKENTDISHRKMSNNSIFYKKKPTREQLHKHIETLRYSGEPGFVNQEAALTRRKDFKGVNPCVEILLKNQQTCNLTTINIMSFVENGVLNKEKLFEAQRLSTRIGYRMTNTNLELYQWDKAQKDDRLLGVSLTGYQDTVNAVVLSYDEQAQLLRDLREVSHNAMKEIAKEIGGNESLLITTVKPEGCWTKEFTRVLDDGIMFIDEINPNIESKLGFSEVNGLARGGNKVTKTYKKETSDIFKITLKNGRIIKISQEHPMSVKGEWVKAKDIKIGDKIDYVLGNYTNKENQKLNDVTIDEFRSDVRDYKTPHAINNDLAWLLGAYYANGSFTTQNRIKFVCQHHNVHLKVQKIWKELFGIETNIIKNANHDKYEQDFRSTKIRKWFKENGLDKYENIENGKTPLVLRKSSNEAILSFIVGYADNDGCFHSSTFCIDSANEKFMRHLQEIGEAIGVSFGISINSARNNSYSKKPIYKIHMSRAFSNPEVVDFVNKNSVKAEINPIKTGKPKSKNPYIIEKIELLENQDTYDIEVENEHWYYQGGLKSHNTISLLPTVSSGVHYSHSPYYIRRVRINSGDALVKVCEELGYPIVAENGEDWETCRTKVIEFPVKAPQGLTKYDVSAIRQLENYKLFMENYVDHNASVTVSVRANEWEEVEEWIWNNWNFVIGISFLSLDDSYYPLLPFEACSKEEYEKRKSEMKPFNPVLIQKYEKEEAEEDLEKDAECATGGCGVR